MLCVYVKSSAAEVIGASIPMPKVQCLLPKARCEGDVLDEMTVGGAAEFYPNVLAAVSITCAWCWEPGES